MQIYRKHQRRHRGGFPLLEVLIVLAILGVIAAMVIPNLLGRQQEAMIRAARISIEGFEKALELYAVDHDGLFPEADVDTVYELLLTNIDEQTGRERNPYLDEHPLDPWKRPLQYEYPPTGNHQTFSGKPAIWSLGPDGQDGTEDDITNWEQQELSY